MYNIKKWKIIILSIFFSINIHAKEAWRDILWTLPSPPKPAPIVLNIDDGFSEATAVISGFSGSFHGRTIAMECVGSHPFGYVKGDKTQWLLVPEEFSQKNAPKLELVPEISGEWMTPLSTIPVPKGYKAILAKPARDPWILGPCYGTGYNHPDVVTNWVDANLKVIASRNRAYPGTYKYRIPIYYVFEEQKSVSGSTPGSSIAPNVPNLMLSMGQVIYLDVTLIVTSKCTIDPGVTNFTLSHGRMTPSEAVGNKSKPYNMRLLCTGGSQDVSVSLIGADPVTGETKNYTTCGVGGNCELTFGSGKYEDKLTVNGSSDITIQSTYHPKSSGIIEGIFTGSAVLEILVI
ncbi:hypothetical protein ACPV34_07455 [Photobacterium damselae]|uniref:hypothetical protein n=1 Tax=Photobacterium damselae TaxID=38293 RepID=UPI004068242B